MVETAITILSVLGGLFFSSIVSWSLFGIVELIDSIREDLGDDE